MTIVEQVCKPSQIPDEYSQFRQDTVTLTWEDRRRGHGKRISDGGVTFAISLPAGTLLKEGDCLILSAERIMVRVREAAESVYVMRPSTPQQWAFFAYQAGNRHQPVMITGHELIFPQNPAVKSLLDQLVADYTSENRPFTAAQNIGGHAHE